MNSSIKLAFAQRVNKNTDCVVTVTDLADQQAFAEALASADILTNGTKVGMKPLENESLVNDISLLHPGLLVTECVYNPHMTKLLQQAQQAGCKTIDGYGMLLWQGLNSSRYGLAKISLWNMLNRSWGSVPDRLTACRKGKNENRNCKRSRHWYGRT